MTNLGSEDPIAAIDWTVPWLRTWREKGEAAAAQILRGKPHTDVLNDMAKSRAEVHVHSIVQFVPHTALPRGLAYERYIFDSNQCPTRSGVHDFFNGLAWIHYPRTKRQLNHLHMREIEDRHASRCRGAVRDGLTVFDENAAFLKAPDALWMALQAKDWSRVFGQLRPLWADTTLLLFGHALIEKLVRPRKPITAHVYRIHRPWVSLDEVDEEMSTTLSADYIMSKPNTHLPILGVPQWWPDNETPSFYDDQQVFRPPKHRDLPTDQ